MNKDNLKVLVTVMWSIALIVVGLYFVSVKEWIGLINYILIWIALILNIWIQ